MRLEIAVPRKGQVITTSLVRDRLLQAALREYLGKPVRLSGDESPFIMMMPPMKLRDFTFTSLSDAV